MTNPKRWFSLAVVALGMAVPGLAQGNDPQSDGIQTENYNIRQTFEVGWRFTDVNGPNPNVYDTFVNLQKGPRLIEHSLFMRGTKEGGLLFDDLSTHSYGWGSPSGGDPVSQTTLRISKAGWYRFNGSFRRMINFWDYNVLANPLNPVLPPPGSTTVITPAVYASTNSPHRLETRRRLYDFGLILAPDAPVRVRLQYTRNRHRGPSFNTFHEGTDVLLFQDWDTTLDNYNAGVDLRFLPRTTISVDQFYSHSKFDTNWANTFQSYRLSNGTPVDLGIIYDPAGNAPCNPAQVGPILDPATTPPTLNDRCNGYQGYVRSTPMRYNYPTTQLAITSSYFNRFDFAARGSYSSSDGDIAIDEHFLGLVTRTRQRDFDIAGPADSKRVNASVDASGTLHFSERLRFVDTFRFDNFRIPGTFVMSELSLFGTSMLPAPVTFDPATCNATTGFTAPACPPHGSSSPADVANEVFTNFLRQRSFYNTAHVEWDITRQFGARVGYRYGNRDISLRRREVLDLLFFPGTTVTQGAPGTGATRGSCALVGGALPPGATLLPDGTCHFVSVDTGDPWDTQETDEIGEHSLLAGLWFRPDTELRISFDLELFSADRAFTRISPRNMQHYKARATYKPDDTVTLNAFFNILESRNNVTDINHKQHNRSLGFSGTFNPTASTGIDFGWNYQDINSQTLICFVGNPLPPGTTTCPTAGAPSVGDLSFFDNNTHNFFFDVMVRPVRRVMLNLGYNVLRVDGDTLLLNPLQPLGPQESTYHRPTAGLVVDLNNRLSWRNYYGFYGYDERNEPVSGSTLLRRNFRGHVVTSSIRYAF